MHFGLGTQFSCVRNLRNSRNQVSIFLYLFDYSGFHRIPSLAKLDDNVRRDAEGIADDGAHDDAGVGSRAEGELGGQLGVSAEGIDVLGHGADVVELGVGQGQDLEK